MLRLFSRGYLILFALLCFIKTFAQTQMKGRVLNESGAPMGNVSIRLNDGKMVNLRQYSSGPDGNFTVDGLRQGISYNLVFVANGYRNDTLKMFQPETNEGNLLLVRMVPADKNLDEVVVVGYGTQRKVNLTGAVSQVSGKVFEDKPGGNIGQSLQGVVPNLNITFGDGHPGATATFNIRGMASLTNNSGSPLVLVDGVQGDINMLNPNDIASVSVLKDAASSAIYGARGAFGVILITTKSGKVGRMSVAYNANYGIQKQTTRTDFMTEGYYMDSLVDVSFSRRNGVSYTGFNATDYENMKKRLTDHSLPDVEIQNRNGVDQYVYYGNTDWYHWLYRNSQPSTTHNLSVSGGSEKINYLVSGRFLLQDGMYQPYLNTDKYHAYNFRAKVDANLSKILSISSNTQFSANNYIWPGWGYNSNVFNYGMHMLASYVPENPDGTATYITNLNNYQITNGLVADLLHGKSKGGSTNYNFSTTFGMTLRPFAGLEINGNYTFLLTPGSSFQRRTMIPYSIFPGTVSYTGYDQLTKNTNTDYRHIVNVYGTYQENIARHHAKLMFGYNQELQHYSSMKGVANNLLSEDLNQLSLGTGTQQTSSSESEYALLGFFGRLNYDYNNRYLVEFNGRYDGTSRFQSGRRFGFFPSISAGWRVSEENFFRSLLGVISELKLRGSYGSLGNQETGNSSSNLYPYIPVMNSGLSNWVNNGSQVQTISVPNPVTTNLTWEKSATLDGGIDINFLKNRLQISYDIYTRKTSDMLVAGPTLPAVFGATAPTQNAGDLKTNGFDLSIQWRDNIKLLDKPFSYNIGLVLSDYTATVTKFNNPTKILSNYYVGQRIGDIWGYATDGYFASDDEAAAYSIDQSFVNGSDIKGSPGEWGKLRAGDIRFKDLNGDNKVNNGTNTLGDHGDMKVIGNSLPRYSFGINGGFSWNNIDFSVFLQGIGKMNWYPSTEAGLFWGPYERPYWSLIPKNFMNDIWSESNPNAYFPLLRGYSALNATLSNANDKYIQNLAYLRVKNLTIGYSLPNNVTHKIGLSRLHVYFSGQNLFTWTKFHSQYIDPEQVGFGGTDKAANAYPFFKTYSFGLDLQF
ncbi:MULTISPECIES: SusC/RagA family TonB-linked outer membrane protein [Chitinophagaceae]